MNLKELPKVELHIHLDCSLSYKLVKTLNPDCTEEEYRTKFQAPVNCASLTDYIAKAEPAIALMQTREALQLATLDLAEQFYSDNVIYAEIRFAPLEHCKKGLTPREVVEAVTNAAEVASQQFGLEMNIILCCLRQYTEEKSLEVARLAEIFKNNRVVGLDLAGDENLPAKPHQKAFQFAADRGIHRTTHAGEACGSESVEEAIRLFKPDRIGHGVRSSENAETVSKLKEKNIHLEVCPSSNLLTGIYKTYKDHRIHSLAGQGVSLSINTDGRTISNVDLFTEYKNLKEAFNWGRENFLKHNLQAAEHAFTTEEVKESIRKKLLEAYR